MVLQAVGSIWGERGSFNSIIFIEVSHFSLKPIVPFKVVCKTHAEMIMLIPNRLLTVSIKSSCCISGPEISLGHYVSRVFGVAPVRARSPTGIVDQGGSSIACWTWH